MLKQASKVSRERVFGEERRKQRQRFVMIVEEDGDKAMDSTRNIKIRDEVNLNLTVEAGGKNGLLTNLDDQAVSAIRR